MERTLEDGKAWMRDQLARRRHRFGVIDPAVAAGIIDALGGLEPETWAAGWLTPAFAFVTFYVARPCGAVSPPVVVMFEDYVARCPELSLLDQGVLDQPSCPLLLVNGRDDLQNASADIYLALEHGDPKTARLFPGGHMGEGPVMATVLDWLSKWW